MSRTASSSPGRLGVAATLLCFVFVTLLANADARAVNISNTWILPQEGFPVFYRYFRDRISWYEADAVCQFHHANLVTVDTTAQYDAARAYLKELDIMSNVWIGLIKSNEEGDFSWTDYKPLSGEGYWGAAPAAGRAPLCAALDPARDFRWAALSCGGPQVASFICELPVPAWAVAEAGGCLVRSLPSLTVQFLPELAAVQLVSDCGLDGTKQVTCKPNEPHKDILKELSCAMTDDDFSDNTVSGSPSASTPGVSSGSPRVPGLWGWASTPAGDLPTTRLRRQTPLPSSPLPPTSTAAPPSQPAPPPTILSDPVPSIVEVTTQFSLSSSKMSEALTSASAISSKRVETISVSKIPAKVSVTSTHIPIKNKTPLNTVTISSATPATAKPKADSKQSVPFNTDITEDKQKEHHDIFTQATDHFIPPLVMAKSKLSADMTVVSPESKHLHKVTHHVMKSPKLIDHLDTTVLPIIFDATTTKPADVAVSLSPTRLPTPITTTEGKQIAVNKVSQIVTMIPAIKVEPKQIMASLVTENPTEKSTPLMSTMSPTKVDKQAINENDQTVKDIKYRKPGKGKKYDKITEDKKLKMKKDFTITTEASTSTAATTHKVIELTIPHMTGSNIPVSVIEITTKLSSPSTATKEVPSASPVQITSTQPLTKLIQTTTEEPKILIDPNILELNKNGKINHDSEIIQHTTNFTVNNENVVNNTDKENKPITVNTESHIVVTTIPLVTDKNESKDTPNPQTSEEAGDHTPDPIPRPNRSRLLTHPPQHRSFYPYFFNRVLG